MGKTSFGIAAVAAAVVGHAQELSALGGAVGTGATHGTSYAWELEYRHQVGRGFAWSAAWLNEGHTPAHHRDGLALEFWAIPLANDEDFSLALGAGAYRYADTHFLPGDGFANDHGWTPILSLSASYYTGSPWFLRLTGNHVDHAAGMQTNTLVAGVGYQLGWVRHEPKPRQPRERTAHRLTAMTGRTIVNSRSSQLASATVIEYRHAAGRHFDWTIAWVDEGDPHLMHREGVTTQLWLVDEYWQRRLGVGLGAGPYFLFTREGPPDVRTDAQFGTAMIITPTISWRFGARWQGRLSWNRVFSHNNRDVDVIVAGLGFGWGAR